MKKSTPKHYEVGGRLQLFYKPLVVRWVCAGLEMCCNVG